MRFAISILIAIFCIESKAQRINKEAHYFNDKNQIYQVERTYLFDTDGKLYCSFDGNEMQFKYIKSFPDSTLILWKTLLIGDPAISFCLSSSEFEQNGRQLLCKKGDLKMILDNLAIDSVDIKGSLKRANIKQFLDYKGTVYLEEIDFDQKEKLVYENNNLIRLETYRKENRINTTYFTYEKNKVKAFQYNAWTNIIESESELNWDMTMTRFSLSRKHFLPQHIDYSNLEIVQSQNLLTTTSQGEVCEEISINPLTTKPLDILKNRFYAYYQNNAIYIDQLESKENIFSYRDKQNNLHIEKKVSQMLYPNLTSFIDIVNGVQLRRIDVIDYSLENKVASTSNMPLSNLSNLYVFK